MKRLVYVAVASLIGTTILIGTATPSHACSCLQGTDEANFAGADVVFIGTAVDGVHVRGTDRVFDPWRFDVESVQKGPDVADFLIHTESAELTFVPRKGFLTAVSSCGFYVQAGHRYQIFADRTPSGGLTTGRCSANRDLAASEPYRPATGAAPPLVTAAIALAALALAAMWSRRLARVR